MLQFDEDKQNRRLSDMHDAEEERFVELAATNQGLSYLNMAKVPVVLDALRLIPQEQSAASHVIAFDIKNKLVTIGVPIQPTETTAAVIEGLRAQGYEIRSFVISSASFKHAFKSYQDLSLAVQAKAGSIDISDEQITELLAALKTTKDIEGRIASILSEKATYKISRVIEVILAGALAVNASDIHIEPEDAGAVLRLRLDGVLNIIQHFDKETYDLIVNRLKLISGLKINVRNQAQDGRFGVNIKNDKIDLRVSTLPGSGGESIVMRVLNPKSIRVSIEEMGMEPRLLSVLEREIQKPNGMILTTGPTGSGKTTTLYAFLRKVYSPEMKIITIENPVEYHLEGLVQSQVDAEHGFTFLHGLRAAVRQDPDIIMVGEIRDEETAATAVDAALTGHLVFSTLHTNNAAGAYTRFIDLKVNPKIVTSALTVSIAQRLARKLCVKCKREREATLQEKTVLERILATINDRDHVSEVKTLWDAPGCEACNGTGFKGRLGIFEAIVSDGKIESVVVNNPSEREIKKAAEGQGILNLRQDGAMKIMDGVTSVEEVNRVIDLAGND